MAIDALSTIASLPRLSSPPAMSSSFNENSAAGGFAGILSHFMAENQQANAAATSAIEDLATGKAQDLHSVTLAVAQADVSFRMILEMRNRLSDALQEITRMQV
jgi:flagellar hook-basal body complex protein FliE